MSQVVTASFNGIPCAVEFSSTLGTSSGTGTIEFADISVNLPYKGTLVISDGERTQTLNNIYVDKPRIEYDSMGGARLSATIHDRRFAWKWGFIVGNYNQPDYNNIPTTDITLKGLIQLCLVSLGEVGYILHNIPETYPAVKWEPETPANALEDLCDEHGLVIGLDASVANNPVVVAPYDYSRVVPDFLKITATEGVSSAIKPSWIIFFGGRSVFQEYFENLIPVGEDTDGTIKRIEDLSFAPSDWGDSLRKLFTDLSTEAERELADKCIFKWFAIDWDVYDPNKILPLLSEIVDTITDEGVIKREKPYVIGTKTLWDGTSYKISSSEKISEGFTIDKNLGILKFNELVVKPKTEDFASGGFIAGVVNLVAAYHKKENDMSDFFTYGHPIQGGTELPVFYEDSNVVLMFKRVGTSYVTQNYAELRTHVKGILGSMESYFTSRFPKIYTYPGVFSIGAWGGIRNVIWRADPLSGAITEIHKDLEVPRPMLPDYTDKQIRRKFKVLWKTRKDTREVKKLWPFE